MIRHGWLIGLCCFFVLLSFSGCGKDRSGSGWASFPVTIYAQSTIQASVDAQADLTDAMKFWEEKAGKQLFDYKGAWSGGSQPYTGTAENPGAILGNVIFFQNPWPFAMNIAGQTTVISSKDGIQSSMIMMNAEAPFCPGDCAGRADRVSQRKAFAHELGHFLGMQHIEDTRNIMNPVITPGGVLTDEQIDEVTFVGLVAGQG